MYELNTKVNDPSRKIESVSSFIGGLNTFQDPTMIKPTELTDAKNVMLEIDGAVPRYGTERVLDNGGVSAKTTGLYRFYDSYDSSVRQQLRIFNGKLQKRNVSVWSDVSATTFSTDVLTYMVEVRNAVYLFNTVDGMRKWDGTTLTSYTQLSTPTGLTVTPNGTTGSETYAYAVSAFDDNGETLACSVVTITNGNSSLSASNYNKLTWNAVTGAAGYNVWGRTNTGIGVAYMNTVYTNEYTDDGSDTPLVSVLPPEGNSTGGIKGSMACFAVSRIFVAGDPDNPSRLYWGGVGDQIDNFSFAPEGGGAVDVYKDDGSPIRAIIPFQGGVIVGKDTGIFKFYFMADTGLPRLEEITRSFGMISQYGVLAVENDVIFPARKNGRLAFYSLGNQENYSASVLRTNELSIKISPSLTDVNLEMLPYASAFYYRNIYGCAIPTSGSTTNDRIWVLDVQLGSWSYWEGFETTLFSIYGGADGDDKLYFGHPSDGYVYEMWKDSRNDNGEAIDVVIATKAFNQKEFASTKTYLFPTVQFKDISGSGDVTVEIITDGVITAHEFNVNELAGSSVGVGASLVGELLVGDASGGTPAEGEAYDDPRQANIILTGRSIKYRITSSTVGLKYKVLAVQHAYMVHPDLMLPSNYRVYS